MNYYNRHIGDYLKDTAHLSLLEHGVYTRLLDVYYTRESAIPENQAARLVGARSVDELQALEQVLQEFFVLSDGVWTHRRCDRELQKKDEKATTNRENGRKGGRPRKVRNDFGSTEKPTEQPNENPNGFQNKPTENPNQEPIANNQEPILRVSESVQTATSVGAVGGTAKTSVPDIIDLTVHHRAIALNMAVDLDNELGKFLSHMRSTAKLSADWGAEFEKWLRRARDFGGGKDGKPQRRLQQGHGAATGKPWFLTAPGIESKARTLGFEPPDGVPLGVWKFDVFKMAGLTEREYRAAEVDYA